MSAARAVRFGQIRVDPNDDQKIFVTGRRPEQFDRRREDLARSGLAAGQALLEDVRRRPDALDRPAELRPHDPRKRRRRIHVLRRREDLRSLLQPAARRVLRHRRRYGGSRTTSTAGLQDHETGSCRRTDPRARSGISTGWRSGAGDGMYHPGRSRPTAGGSTRRGSTAGHYRVDQKLGYRVSIMPAEGDRETALPVPLVRPLHHLAAQQPGHLHRSARSCSGRWTAATTGRRSAPT